MAAAQFELRGQVTRSDTGLGIHGVHVEAWDVAIEPSRLLGTAFTNRDGSYHIDLRSSSIDNVCCECPKVFLKLRDRDCRLIHDGCADRRCCEPGEPLRIDVVIAPEALWWHLVKPLSWERILEPLVPVHVMQEIEDGIELLHAKGLLPDVASLKLAVCATPPIEGFGRLLQDAWDALQGDLEAAQRYREVLDILCGTEYSCCGESASFASEVDTLFESACTEVLATDCKEPEPCAPCTPEQCAESGCSCGAPFVTDDKALLLAMAALHVACGKQTTAKRYLQVLLYQFCRFATLNALHAASLKALLSDDTAKAHVRELLAMLCTHCPPTPGKADCAPREPLRCCVPCLGPKLASCLREAIESWCRIHCYHICEVRPPRACPGEEILIVGCGFGEQPGQVVFRGQSGALASTSVAAKSWCDDRISVVVPHGASCGMWLQLPPTTITICGRYLEFRPIGCIDKGFEGTSAEILRFDIRGHTAGECPLHPGNRCVFAGTHVLPIG